MANLQNHLAGVGAKLSDVVKTLCFLTDMDTFATFNEAYVAGFGSHRPARSTIGVASLPANGAVEIEAWVYLPAAKPTKPAGSTKPAKSTKPARSTKPAKKSAPRRKK
jgi:hypothetical protein